MTVRDVKDVLGARVLAGEEFLDREVKSACGSDMMSDVLAFSKDHSVLLTGLCNPQVIRTAEMLDIVCIIFVRGKKPDESMLEMARDPGAWGHGHGPPHVLCLRYAVPGWAARRGNLMLLVSDSVCPGMIQCVPADTGRKYIINEGNQLWRKQLY